MNGFVGLRSKVLKGSGMNPRSIALALLIAFPGATRLFATNPQPNVADMLKEIRDNVERTEGVSLETLYTITITQQVEVQREYFRSKSNSEVMKHLDSITSETEIMKTYVKRWSMGQRNAHRLFEFHSQNGKTDLIRNLGGGHDGDFNRYVQYGNLSSKLVAGPPAMQDHIAASKPGYYSFVHPNETPWGFVGQHFGLVDNRVFHGENEVVNGVVDLNHALTIVGRRRCRDAGSRRSLLDFGIHNR